MITVIVTLVWMISLGFVYCYGVIVGAGRELDREANRLIREQHELIIESKRREG